MELKREDVSRIIDFIRRKISSDDELKGIINVECEYDYSELICGVSNKFLSDLIETITGNKTIVVGKVEELYKCPCCGYKTLTERYNAEEGTGYDICPLCGWEDDGTTKVDEYRSINKGTISDFRKKLFANNITNKWLLSASE